MAVTAQLASEFDSAVRRRGADYWRDGRVRIKHASASRIDATVRGTARYQVELEREGRSILASCTCPYFDMALCKHIWAVIMASESQRLLQKMSDHGRIEVVRRELDEDDFDEEDFEDEDFDDAEEDDEGFEDAPRYMWRGTTRARPRARSSSPRNPRKSTPASWRKQIAQLHRASPAELSPAREAWPSKRELLYVIDVASTVSGRGVYLEIFFHDLKRDGTWGKPKSRYLPRHVLHQLPDASDRRILALLAGANQTDSSYEGSFGANFSDYRPSSYYDSAFAFRYRLLDPQPELILPDICQTGRCRLRLQPDDEDSQWLPITWEDGEPWQFRLEMRASQKSGRYELAGALLCGSKRMDLREPLMLVDAGILFTRERAARYDHGGAFNWIALLRKHGEMQVPIKERDDFLAELLRQTRLPPLDLPEELRYAEITLTPRSRLVVKADKSGWRREQLVGELSFDYDGTVVAFDDPVRGVVQTDQRRVLLRDVSAERAADERLQLLGWRWGEPTYMHRKPQLQLAVNRLPAVVRELTLEGWHIEAEGKLYRPPGKFDIQVRSGIDWFELHGDVEFGDTVAHLPELLAAVRRGENIVRLGDGTFGLLPEEWLKKYGLLAGLGAAHDDHLRFARSQVGLLDALLAAQPEAQCDALFVQARDELRRFAGIRSTDPPAGFCGELRPYQKEGLGWLNFLQQFGFGGCLADDMGLGKTVQVLALLEARRERREQGNGHAPEQHSAKIRRRAVTPPSCNGPALVVMPKSLIFNWKQEAARFAPRLRVLDHTGHLRHKGNGRFADYDVILTTYGTLRNDVVDFKNVRFDYVILDEAQAIKNADSASAKAARLLSGDHRLALSGTPIENHLGELWSLFKFLNPGMLGAASVFRLTHAATRNPDEETRKLLAQALRPFLLRRTKQQVVRDLPPKVEQTLYCELEGRQRKLYDELRDHYRGTLLKRIDRGGIGRAKIQILEALLRLRQAAIHPGLLDKQRARDSSAKLDMLLPQLLEVLDEGHKTLVFSQFTGMLSILREHLDREAIAYEYLDGKTRDRQARVERFQSDPECRLFLISLKAGGLGLNLTAAQYVFLLDPWWNPAVEAQAIDRAHRIGQTNRVFAYRLIARDTVEEKVLALQNTKRDLADAIVNADNSLVRNLRREDLELLLS